ncbi:hypothetical protein BV20DRAFT_62681 [Pilatotrama ljubarskyi]|nr:hypothetical protein BV20DRAFT_62681 [Pilatotrama ljubarskyi]
MSAMIHPAGKRFLMRKSSNAENLPPTAHTAGHSKKAEALVSAREASRRRRARVVSGSAALRKVVQNAQRRASKSHARPAPCKLEPVVEPLPPVAETQETPAQAAQPAQDAEVNLGPTLRFPRWLPRPPNFPAAFDRANIDACGSDVHGVPHDYILRGLDVAGHSMWQLVNGAILDTDDLGTTLPEEVDVIIPDHVLLAAASPLPSSFPTHVLAVWEAPSEGQGLQNGVDPRTGRRKVRLVPVHNLVLAAHCANWFPMPSKKSVEQKRVMINNGGAMGTLLKLPVVPVPVPHINTFHQLLGCLYTHRVSRLLDQLVPVQRPAYVLPTPQNPRPQNPHYIKETGRRLGARYQPWAIVGMLREVVGLYQNACQMGISDKRLWISIDWSWDMLLTGLAYALGRPEAVPRPQPRIFRGGAAPQQRQQRQAATAQQPAPAQQQLQQQRQQHPTPSPAYMA